MAREGQTFEEALKKAQELGYAERNPEADVEGYDTCRKITILTSLATGKEVNYEDVPTEGITKITVPISNMRQSWEPQIKLIWNQPHGRQ